MLKEFIYFYIYFYNCIGSNILKKIIKWGLFIIIIHSLIFTSIVLEASKQADRIYGVITANEVVARQGDSQNYPTSFKEPLHSGTEFDLIENRSGWFHIILSDDSDGWIPEDTAELI